MDVVVLGSANVDVVFECESFPKPGETLLCSAVSRGPGGKGLNQAVAAARAGAKTMLCGAIGDDADGEYLAAALADAGVDTASLTRLTHRSTGLAHIVVDRSGENSIVVAGGANQAESEELPLCELPDCEVRLAQLEMETGPVKEFFQAAKDGTICILNAAPARLEASELLGLCDVIVVNEHELSQFAGRAISTTSIEGVEDAAKALLAGRCAAVIVTRGAAGTAVATATDFALVEAREVTPIDTTGAGDCFCGVLAAGLSQSTDLLDAVRYANSAASIAVTRKGAATAMPVVEEIAALISVAR